MVLTGQCLCPYITKICSWHTKNSKFVSLWAVPFKSHVTRFELSILPSVHKWNFCMRKYTMKISLINLFALDMIKWFERSCWVDKCLNVISSLASSLPCLSSQHVPPDLLWVSVTMAFGYHYCVQSSVSLVDYWELHVYHYITWTKFAFLLGMGR